LAAKALDFPRQAVLLRCGDKFHRLVERSVVRTAHEALVAEDLSGIQIHNRLKQGCEQTLVQNALQRQHGVLAARAVRDRLRWIYAEWHSSAGGLTVCSRGIRSAFF